MIKWALLLLITFSLFFPALSVSGHGTGGTTKEVGDYLVRFRTFPPFPSTDEETIFFFGIEDRNFQHVTNLTTSVSLLHGTELIREFPDELQKTGDFGYNIALPKDGAYRVILLIEDEGSTPLKVEFEVRSSNGLFDLRSFNTIIPVAVVILVGLVLVKIFRNKKT